MKIINDYSLHRNHIFSQEFSELQMLGNWEENILMTLSELVAAAGDGMPQQKYLCFDYLIHS